MEHHLKDYTKPDGAANSTMINGDTSQMKPNIEDYTNPEHDLWTAPAEPDVKTVQDGSTLKPGEVTIAIKNTGIYGYIDSPTPTLPTI